MPKPEPEPDEPTVEHVSTSELREATYALETFGELGLDPLESLSLIDAGLSPSRLREMVTHGCDVRTALSILL
jgi:hypothetical protein